MYLEASHLIEWAIVQGLAKEKKMDALQKNIAVTRGEALAARLLATIAIQFAFSMTSDRQRLFTRLSAFVDDTLNLSGPAKGDANDEFNTQVRETARFQAMQTLDEIARMLNEPPMKG
jgi:hypothetical protein